MKKLSELHEESKNAQIKVTESLEHLSDIFDDMEKENKKKDEKISKLEERTKNLESDGKTYPIIIKFTCYNVRRDAYSSQKKLSNYQKPNSCICQTIKTGSNKIWCT